MPADEYAALHILLDETLTTLHDACGTPSRYWSLLFLFYYCHIGVGSYIIGVFGNLVTLISLF